MKSVIAMTQPLLAVLPESRLRGLDFGLATADLRIVAHGADGAYATECFRHGEQDGRSFWRAKDQFKGISRPASRPAQPSQARRRSPAKKSPSPFALAASAGGRAARATWLVVARERAHGRSVGSARHIDPGHRRDGLALGPLALALVIAAASWFDAARPVGAWLDSAAHRGRWCGRAAADPDRRRCGGADAHRA